MNLAHMPSAFSMLGAQSPFFPGASPLPFGGLGSLADGMGAAASLGSPGGLAAALGPAGLNPAASEYLYFLSIHVCPPLFCCLSSFYFLVDAGVIVKWNG